MKRIVASVLVCTLVLSGCATTSMGRLVREPGRDAGEGRIGWMIFDIIAIPIMLPIMAFVDLGDAMGLTDEDVAVIGDTAQQYAKAKVDQEQNAQAQQQLQLQQQIAAQQQLQAQQQQQQQQQAAQQVASNGSTRAPSEADQLRQRQVEEQNAVAGMQCLTVGEANTGKLSTESVRMNNRCNMKVRFQYCIESANGGGAFSCREQKFGSAGAAASDHTTISMMGADAQFRVVWAECKATASNTEPLPVHARYEGGRIVAMDCH